MSKVQDLFDMTGQAAIVTGGGTHLGTAMAESLAELGASVVIASRRKEVCEQVAAKLRKNGLKVEAEGCDATDEAQVAALVRPGGRHNDELLFSPLKSVHTCDLHQRKAEFASCAQALPDMRHLT